MPRHLINVSVVGMSRKQRKEQRQRAQELRAAGLRAEEPVKAVPLPEPAGPALGTGILTQEYWNTLPMLSPAHRATSSSLAGIYPFLADESLGTTGAIIGRDLVSDSLFCFDPWDLYARGLIQSTNLLIIGNFGSGKSGTAKQLSCRWLAFGHQIVVPSDSKGEWVELAERLGGQVIRLGGQNVDVRLNPLARGPRRSRVTDAEADQMTRDRRRAALGAVIEATLKGQEPISAQEYAVLNWALDAAAAEAEQASASTRIAVDPTLTDIYRILRENGGGRQGWEAEFVRYAERAKYVLARFVEGDLQGLFEQQSTTVFESDAPIVVIDTSALFERSELAAQLTQICSSAWIQAVISDKKSRRTRAIIREEGWRGLASMSALRDEQQRLKLSRDYGIVNVMILHKLGDLDAVGAEGSQERALAYSLVADIANKFIFRQSAEELGNLTNRLKVSETLADLTRTLATGAFLGLVGQRQFVVDAFSVTTAWERDLFTTDAALHAGARGRDEEAPSVGFFDGTSKSIEQLWAETTEPANA